MIFCEAEAHFLIVKSDINLENNKRFKMLKAFTQLNDKYIHQAIDKNNAL
jgi:hypothetical protein